MRRCPSTTRVSLSKACRLSWVRAFATLASARSRVPLCEIPRLQPFDGGLDVHVGVPHGLPEGVDREVQGSLRHRLRGLRETTLARQKEMGIVPADTELPPINPIGTPETRTGPDGQPFPALDVTLPWDSLTDDEQASVRPDGRGVCRVPRPRRQRDRPVARLPRGVRPAREHRRDRRLRQRRVGEGGPNGSVNEMSSSTASPTTIDANLAAARRARRPHDVQPLPQRVGHGVQHAVQDVEALEFNGGTSDPCIISWPAGTTDAARSATNTTTPSTSCRRSWTCSASIPRRRSRATPRAPSTASACGTASMIRPPAQPTDPVLFDARLAGHLARRLEGHHHAPDDQRMEPFQRRRVGAVPHRRRPLRTPQPRRRASRKGPRAGQPLVRRGRRQRRLPPR